jgi:hypothetical protein
MRPTGNRAPWISIQRLPVRLPAANSTFLSEQTSHQQPVLELNLSITNWSHSKHNVNTERLSDILQLLFYFI